MILILAIIIIILIIFIREVLKENKKLHIENEKLRVIIVNKTINEQDFEKKRQELLSCLKYESRYNLSMRDLIKKTRSVRKHFNIK